LFRHQVEKGIEGNNAKKADAIDIIKVGLSGKEKGNTETKDEEGGSSKICIVHYVLIDTTQGIEDCQRFVAYVLEVNAELFKKRGLALYAACAKRGPPRSLRLNVASERRRLLVDGTLNLTIKTCSGCCIVFLGLCVELERFLTGVII
jgi:hypothetical protein